jgi:glycolate oxidase iron-sulfur subunit
MPKPMSLSEVINKQDIIDTADQCVMCGLCLPHCPTYTLAQTESESPRGRIALVRALYEGKLDTSDSISSHLGNCLTCMNCERVCPANVDYEKIIDAGRAVTHKQNSWFENLQQSLLLFSLSENQPRKLVKSCISIFRSTGLHRVFPSTRLLSLLPDKSAATPKFNAHQSDKHPNGPTVAILNSCAADLVNDETLNAARLILSKLDCNVIEQKQTLCCGALHQHTGDLKTAKQLRQNFISSFDQQNLDYLVSLATGCGVQIKRYAKLDNTGLEEGSVKSLTEKHFDVNEFVLQQIKKSNLRFKPLNSKIYVHKPCSQAQISKENSTVEQLLNYIPKAELITFEDKLSCCGAGGMNTISQSKLAEQLIEKKVQELKNSTANYLVSSNIGCALHFQAKLRQEGIAIHIFHPITLLAQQVL